MNEQLFWLKSIGRKGEDFLRKSCSLQNFKVIFIICFLQVSLSYPLCASSKRAMDITKDKKIFFVRGGINSNPLRFLKTFRAKGISVKEPVVLKMTASSNKATDFDKPLKVYAWVSGAITCSNPKVTLYVSVSVSHVSYLWTGPNGFVSKLKNPVVSIAGTYKVRVTSRSGHSATATVKIIQDIKAPGVTTSVSGSLSCTKTSVTLTGASHTWGVTYKWTGPNNFVSAQQSPVVSAAGTYMLVVTNPVNGCTSTASVSVLQNITIPDVTVSGGVLNCTVTQLNLNASSSVSGITYSWSGPSGFTSTQQKPMVASPGDYIVTVTDPANGCTSTDTVTVEQDIDPPGVTAKSGDLGCSVATVNLNAESQAETITYLWTGPDGFSSTLKNPEVSMVGTYKVLVTDTTNGCTSTDSTKVGTTAGTPTVAWFETFDDLANGTKIDKGVTSWKRNVSNMGATGTAQVISHRFEASYLQDVVVWRSDKIDISKYSNVVISVDVGSSGTLTNKDFIKVFFRLNGEDKETFDKGIIKGAFAPITISTPPITGDSIQVIIRMKNQAADAVYYFDNVKVTANLTSAFGVVAFASNKLNCNAPQATLKTNVSLPGVTYSWTGPDGYTSDLASPVITVPGTYKVTIVKASIGCSGNDSVVVPQNIKPPKFKAKAQGKLTCISPSVTLIASSKNPKVSFSWAGFPAGLNPVVVTAPGNYYVTATNARNGCTKTDTVTVKQKINKPDMVLTVSGLITCSAPSVSLTAASATPNTSISWIDFPSGSNPVTVTNPGIYYAVVTDTVTGCAKRDSIIVQQDTTMPNLSTTVSGMLDCVNSSVTLSASITTPNTTLMWTGYPAGQNSITVSNVGTYTVVAKDTVNECSSSATAEVTAAPSSLSTVWFETFDDLANGTKVDKGVTAWKRNVSQMGANGYAEVRSKQFEAHYLQGIVVWRSDLINITSYPNIRISVDLKSSGTLTTDNDFVKVFYRINGQDREAFEGGLIKGAFSPVTVTTPPLNGDSLQVVIRFKNNVSDASYYIDNIKLTSEQGPILYPMVSSSGKITCKSTQVALSTDAVPTGVTYSWTGPKGFTSILPNPVVTVAGDYTVTVTKSAGCSGSATITVDKDVKKPNLTDTLSGMLNCINSQVTLTAATITKNTILKWDGFAVGQNSVTISNPGIYIVTATDTTNGCSTTKTDTVVLDIVKPVSNIISPADSPVELTNNTLSAEVVNNVTYLWTFSSTNTNWYIVSGANTPDLTYHAGDAKSNATYTLKVTSNQNGCDSTSQIVLTAVSSLKSAPMFAANEVEGDKVFQFKAYPNPFSDQAMIEFSSDQSSHVTIGLYTGNGSLARVLFNGDVLASQPYKVAVDGTVLAEGTYQCVVRIKNKVFVYKLLVIN